MRIVFVGATPESVETARILIKRGHDVVLVEADRKAIDEFSESLDCSFLHGDGTKPNVLREAAPEKTDVLFCLTDEDQVNILAGLVGQSIGFNRVIQHPGSCIRRHLRRAGLQQSIVPARTISRFLADLVEGLDVLSSGRESRARPGSFLSRQTTVMPGA